MAVVFLCVCLGAPGAALAAEEECADAATLSGAAAISLAKMPDIVLKSDDRAQQLAELRTVFKAANPQLDVESAGFAVLAEALLAGTSARKIAASQIDRKQTGYAVYLPLENAIKACRAPDAFKAELERYWCRQYAVVEMISGDTVEAEKTIAAIPAGWETVQIEGEKELCAELARRCPRLAEMEPQGRKRVLDWIAAFNPRLRGAGYYLAPAGKVEESWLHTILPLEGGQVRVCLYQLLPGGPVLLPPSDEALKALPAKPPEEAYDCALPEMTRTSPYERRLVLRFQGQPNPRTCNLWEITLYVPAGDGPANMGFSTAPLLSNSPKPLQSSGLAVVGNRLTGEVAIASWRIDMDAVVQSASGVVSGSFRATLAEPKVTCTGLVSGLVIAGTGLDDTKESLAKIEKVLAGAGLSPQSTTRIEKDFGRPMGPMGSGAGIDTGAPLVDSLAQARFCWRSEEAVPGSYAATPQGGYASPMVWGGNVYQMFYDLPTDDVFDESYLNVWLDNLRKNDPARLVLFLDALRRKCSVSAHDVLFCLDGQTGRTKWKASFMRKGCNYCFQARGIFISTKTGPVGTPSVVDGRVFFRGSAGRVYCLDAKDGSLVWESTIGWRHDQIEMHKRACRRTKTAFGAGYDMCSSPGVSDGVVVLHGHNARGTKLFRGASDLVGLDARTGKELWRRENLGHGFNSPLSWRHGGREYVIVGADSIHCLEPKTGKTLWTISGATMEHKTPLDENHILVMTGGEKVGCYRIAPSGATRLWETAFPGANPRGLILKGMVFIPASPDAVCLDLETGAVLGKQPGLWLHVPPSGIGDRAISDVSNNGGAMRMYRLGKDGGFVHLGDHGIPTTCCTTPSIADGRLIVRGRNEVLCYDLREDPERNARNAAQLAAMLGSGDQMLEEQVTRGLELLGEHAVPAVLAVLERAVAAAEAPKVSGIGRSIGAMSASIRDQALPILLKAVKGDKQLVASAAAQALGSWGGAAAKAVPVLRETMQLAQPMVERACREAVRAIELNTRTPSSGQSGRNEQTTGAKPPAEIPPEPAAPPPEPLAM